MRRLVFTLAALLLVACSSKEEAVHLATGCDGPDGSCVRYLRAVDSEGAPLDRSSLVVPFTGPVRLSDKHGDLTAVTASFNFETRADELKLVPVRAMRVDAQNPRQVTIELDGLLADGSALDLPDGVVQNGKGRSVGVVTVKVNTGMSSFGLAMAGVVWDPTDRGIFAFEGTQKPKGQKGLDQVRQELEGRLRIRPGITDETVNKVLEQYDSEALKKKVPDNRVRAGLLLLTGTSAEYAIQFITSDTNRRGVPFQPIEVSPILTKYGAFAAVFYDPFSGLLRMMVDTDMAAESLENIAVVLSHETLHSSLGGGSASEETLAMASDTRVYEELLLFDPAIALAPTDFTRQNNLLLLALRNSGRFAFPSAGLLPRPGVDDALRGAGREPVRSFKDFLFRPDFYGEIPKAGGHVGTEVIESYYQKFSGSTADNGRLKFDQNTIKLYDVAIDKGFSDQQILAITDALRLKATPRGPAR